MSIINLKNSIQIYLSVFNKDKPNPVEDTPDPVEGTPDLVKGTPDLVKGTPDLVPVPVPVEDTPDPVEGTPDPVEGTPDLVKGTPDLVKGTPDLVPVPVPVPVEDTPDPVEGTPDLVKGTPVPVVVTPNVVIDEFDPIFKKIIYNKFNMNDNKTNMEKEEFYTNLQETNLTTSFYLTNGMNKNFVSGGGGTNLAITNITSKFFNITNFEVIFNSKEIVIKNNLTDELQKITHQNILSDYKYPGTVFYISDDKFKYLSKFEIKGVYHINGWNHSIKNIENTNKYKILVTEYYKNIMDHFFKKCSNDSKHMSILHLIQCPGKLFNGGEITANILIKTVKEYLIKNKDQLTNLNFKISIDYKN